MVRDISISWTDEFGIDQFVKLTPELEQKIATQVIANLSLFRVPDYRNDIIHEVFQKLRDLAQ